MLGRRLLKRLTRLGLATYAMTWCMTFTVCASENPVADIIVADTASLIVESSDTGSDTGILTEGDTGIISADNPADIHEGGDIIVGNDEDDIILTYDTPTVSDDIITELTEDAVAGEDMVIGTYGNEEYMEADGAGGVGLPGPAINNVKELRINYGDNISIDQREDFKYSITAMRTTESGVSWETDVTNLTTKGTLSWGLYDVNGFDEEIINATSIKSMPKKLHGITVTKVPGSVDVVVSFENADPRAKVYLVAAYKEHEDDSYVAIGKCHVDVKITGTVEDLEAHLPQKSLNVEMYKTTNTLPVTIRMSDAGRSGETPDFNITEVSFDSKYSMLNNYFNISVNPVNEEKYNLVIIANEDAINDDSVVDMFKSYKKGISTNLNLNVTDGKNSTILTTLEKITFTFGDEKPTAKTVKATGTLGFDCWRATDFSLLYNISSLNFTGAKVGRIAVPDKDKDAWAKLGIKMVDDGDEQFIYSTLNLTKKGNGKLNLVAFIDDPSYNLPDGYNVTVPVSYKIIDSTPTLSFEKSSVSLNKNAKDTVQVVCTLKSGLKSSYDSVKIRVMDSKGETEYDTWSNRPIIADYTNYKNLIYIKLKPTERAKFGASYKVRVSIVSGFCGRESASKDITVKMLSEKNSANMDISLKSKGSIDASTPYQPLNLTITGKNVNLYGMDYGDFDCSIALKNKTDITDYFWPDFYDDGKGNFICEIYENEPFILLKKGLGGQQAIANITVNINGTLLSKTCSFKIGESTITPKLNTDKITMNPVYDAPHFEVILGGNGELYDYNVEFLDKSKKNASSHFEYEVKSNGFTKWIHVNLTSMSDMAGKTWTMKITPVVSGCNLTAKSASVTITVLGAKKSAVTMSAKTNGSIDVVRDDTFAAFDLDYKNMHDPYAWYINTTVLNITDSKKNDVTEKFNCSLFSNLVKIRRGSGVDDIAEGTYKATIEADLGAGGKVTTVASFKVVRGNTKTKISPTSITLVNRDYVKSCPVNIEHISDVNEITNVTLGAYDDVFELVEYGSKEEWRVKLKYGYVEKTKKGVPISSKVKKTVPVNVYYNGSSKPDKVSLTVYIEP